MAGDPCTVLSGCYVKGVLNVRLRFGEPRHVEKLRDGFTHYTFIPGQRFGFRSQALPSPRRCAPVSSDIAFLACNPSFKCMRI